MARIARAHIFKQKDPLLGGNFLISEINDWKGFLSQEENQAEINLFKTHTSTGRPLGDNRFIEILEAQTGKILHKQKPGPGGKG